MARGFAGDGSPAAAGTTVAEKGYAGAPEVSSSSSSYPGSNGVRGGVMAEGDDGEELQLGLSLGSRMEMTAAGGGRGRRGAAWSGRCRILTAEDLPSMGSRVGVASSPVPSSSSSVSSSSPAPNGGANGEKRVSDNTPGNQMVVGWPPVRAYRINNIVNQSKENNASLNGTAAAKDKMTENSKMQKTAECICAKDSEKKARLTGKSLLVKVNLDGDQIGRKVDLSVHASYETLALALETMFYKLRPATGATYAKRTSSLLDGSSGFALTYEDKDGDWMLVGDVPWGMFLNTVRRIRIMKSSDTNGLVPPSPS